MQGVLNERKDKIGPITGNWHVEIKRKSGKVEIFDFKNTIVNEGKNLLLNVMFGATSKTSTWYMGLIDDSGYSASPNTDTISSHSGWTEFTTYSQTVRGTWGAGTASSQSITNASAVQFDITATATLFGIFIVTNNTKSGTSGTLWSTAAFPSPVSVQNGDQIKMTYTLSA